MRKTLILSLLAAGAAASAQAQQPDAAGQRPSQEIVVEGSRVSEREIADFVEALTPAPYAGQLGRFDWAVCPAAVGLGNERNAAVAARLRRVADAAGIRTARAGCRPNVLLLVTDDKRRMVEQLEARYPAYFEGVSTEDFRRLAQGPGPVAAWQVRGMLDPDGFEAEHDMGSGQYVIAHTGMGSHISVPTRPHFIASLVVVDIDALKGLTVMQVADYAAMRAFARTDPSRLAQSSAPTILGVLDAPMGSAVPVTLTQWDLSFLKALYASSPYRSAKRQRNEMKRILRNDLGDPE